jgi:hypothetical protein
VAAELLRTELLDPAMRACLLELARHQARSDTGSGVSKSPEQCVRRIGLASEVRQMTMSDSSSIRGELA